jgi:hypothetical protein
MPKLFEYVDHSGFYIVTSIRNSIVTYQVTSDGIKSLKELGIKPGELFNRYVLLGLISSNDAYTGRSGPGKAPPEGPGIQLSLPFDYPNEQEQENMMPVCAECSSPDDLHLVELLGERHWATILCFICREKKLSSIDASIPLLFVTRRLLNRTLEMKQINERDQSVENYRKLLDMKFEEKWNKVAEAKQRSQEKLFDDPKEGKLL